MMYVLTGLTDLMVSTNGIKVTASSSSSGGPLKSHRATTHEPKPTKGRKWNLKHVEMKK